MLFTIKSPNLNINIIMKFYAEMYYIRPQKCTILAKIILYKNVLYSRKSGLGPLYPTKSTQASLHAPYILACLGYISAQLSLVGHRNL